MLAHFHIPMDPDRAESPALGGAASSGLAEEFA
jgi:hypothetical protein